jgi:predicted metalloprotease
MRWDRGYQSNDIEDRRGEGGVGFGGGGMGGVGLFGIFRILSMFGWKGILVGLIIAGVVASRGMCGGGTSPSSTTTTEHRSVTNAPSSTPSEDELKQFVGFVFDDVQKTWHKQMPDYRNTHLVLFRNSTASACGTASTAVGPFYCPVDRKVYIDLSFYEQLRRRFGAPGDFAQAYVIAHELGHHVQNQLGLMGKGPPDSIHIELQADCLAGAWGQDANARGLLEIGDVDEALNAAAQIGDDTLQKKETGHVQPETWTHGSSAQRVASFKKGYEGGAKACGI